MPITRGAIRKNRSDKRKTAVNLRTKKAIREAVAGMRKKPTGAALKRAYKALDKAAKRGVIHKNKAARLKSRLSALGKKK